MGIISSILYEKPGKIFNSVAKSKKMQAKLQEGISDPARFAAAMLVTSIVSKDLVGCGFYTAQSLNNKKIPEEKRKFVAAVDLMNGIIMVGGQFLIGKIIDAKTTPWLKSKFTGISKEGHLVNSNAIFHPDNVRNVVEKVLKAAGQQVDAITVNKVTEKATKMASEPFAKGFGIFVGAIATTAITKRCIAPLLSTPLAGWFKEHVMDKKKPHTKKDRVYYEYKALTHENQTKTANA